MGKHHFSQNLAGVDFSTLTQADCIESLHDILQQKIHGISFSPYIEGQGPGTEISRQQILQRLKIIAPYTRWIRSFSCTEGNQLIPEVARTLGLQTMVGVSLGSDKEMNELELNNAIAIASQGHVDILAVGNEVLLRGDLTEHELLEYIHRAKQAVPDVPVSYVDAYFEFEVYPQLVEACDVILINCYPYWEDCPLEHSLLYVKEMYRRAVAVAQGKPVIISETGWPSTGAVKGATVPSYENALRYFINIYTWAEKDGIDVFYFSSFDESWKIADEGDVGAYWGLWDQHGELKYA